MEVFGRAQKLVLLLFNLLSKQKFIPCSVFATFPTNTVYLASEKKRNGKIFCSFSLDWWINKKDQPSIKLWLALKSLQLFMLLYDELSSLLCVFSMTESQVLTPVYIYSIPTELDVGLLFCFTKSSVNNCYLELVVECSKWIADIYIVALAFWLQPLVFVKDDCAFSDLFCTLNELFSFDRKTYIATG